MKLKLKKALGCYFTILLFFIFMISLANSEASQINDEKISSSDNIVISRVLSNLEGDDDTVLIQLAALNNRIGSRFSKYPHYKDILITAIGYFLLESEKEELIFQAASALGLKELASKKSSLLLQEILKREIDNQEFSSEVRDQIIKSLNVDENKKHVTESFMLSYTQIDRNTKIRFILPDGNSYKITIPELIDSLNGQGIISVDKALACVQKRYLKFFNDLPGLKSRLYVSLKSLLQSEDSTKYRRFKAIQVLEIDGIAGSKARKILTTAFGQCHKKPYLNEVKPAIARALGHIDNSHERSQYALIRYGLVDESAVVRMASIRSLETEKHQGNKTVLAFERILKPKSLDRSKEVRKEAARQLGLPGNASEKAIQILGEYALNDPQESVRIAAIKSLGQKANMTKDTAYHLRQRYYKEINPKIKQLIKDTRDLVLSELGIESQLINQEEAEAQRLESRNQNVRSQNEKRINELSPLVQELYTILDTTISEEVRADNEPSQQNVQKLTSNALVLFFEINNSGLIDSISDANIQRLILISDDILSGNDNNLKETAIEILDFIFNSKGKNAPALKLSPETKNRIIENIIFSIHSDYSNLSVAKFRLLLNLIDDSEHRFLRQLTIEALSPNNRIETRLNVILVGLASNNIFAKEKAIETLQRAPEFWKAYLLERSEKEKGKLLDAVYEAAEIIGLSFDIIELDNNRQRESSLNPGRAIERHVDQEGSKFREATVQSITEAVSEQFLIFFDAAKNGLLEDIIIEELTSDKKDTYEELNQVLREMLRSNRYQAPLSILTLTDSLEETDLVDLTEDMSNFDQRLSSVEIGFLLKWLTNLSTRKDFFMDLQIIIADGMREEIKMFIELEPSEVESICLEISSSIILGILHDIISLRESSLLNTPEEIVAYFSDSLESVLSKTNPLERISVQLRNQSGYIIRTRQHIDFNQAYDAMRNGNIKQKAAVMTRIIQSKDFLGAFSQEEIKLLADEILNVAKFSTPYMRIFAAKTLRIEQLYSDFVRKEVQNIFKQESQYTKVRIVLAETLSRYIYSGPDTVNVLIEFGLKDENQAIRIASLKALSLNKNASPGTAIALVNFVFNEIYFAKEGITPEFFVEEKLEALNSLGAEANSSVSVAKILIANGLKKKDIDIKLKIRIIKTLSQHKNTSADTAKMLIRYGITHQNKEVRCAAIEAMGLGDNTSAETAEILLKILSQKTSVNIEGKIFTISSEEKSEAAKALGANGNASASTAYALLNLLKNNSNYTIDTLCKIITALSKKHNASIEVSDFLIEYGINHSSQQVREATIKALASELLSTESSQMALIGALNHYEDEPSKFLIQELVRAFTFEHNSSTEAKDTLIKFIKRFKVEFLEKFQNQNAPVFEFAILSLACKALGNQKHTGPESQEVLIDILKSFELDDTIRINAAKALGKGDNISLISIQALQEAINDELPRVRYVAVQTLMLEGMEHPMTMYYIKKRLKSERDPVNLRFFKEIISNVENHEHVIDVADKLELPNKTPINNKAICINLF
ncbi:MAG: HEAT repeat domain-containing protein [Pseudomonadota bacterium]